MSPPTSAELLVDLTHRGFAVRASNGALVVSPASALGASDRAALKARRDELLALLAAPEPWSADVAHRLMFDADSLVESLGVDGRHAVIAAAAERVTVAHTARDLLALRTAVTQFEGAVRRAHSNTDSVRSARGEVIPKRSPVRVSAVP